MRHVQFTAKAKRQLAAIDKPQRLAIEKWIADYLEGCENPRRVQHGKPLSGTESGWRYGVGSYRLVCDLEDGELVILMVRVGHRQGVYENLPKM